MDPIDVYAAALLAKMLRLNTSGLPLEHDGEIDDKIDLAFRIATRVVHLRKDWVEQKKGTTTVRDTPECKTQPPVAATKPAKKTA